MQVEVADDSRRGRAEEGRERRVRLGIASRGVVEVIAGLREGDLLVVVGQRELIDGERVEVKQDLTALARRMIESGKDYSALALRAFE